MRRPWLVALLTLAPALSGCGLEDRARSLLRGEDRGRTVVRVGGREFRQADLERFFDSRLGDFRQPQQADQVKSKLLDTFVEEKLLLAEAERRGIEPEADAVRAMVERIAASRAESGAQGMVVGRDAELERSVTESLKMQIYLNQHLLKDVSVGPQESEEYYKQHLGDYVRNDVVHLREILVEEEALANRILDSLRANRNKNFGELARLHSKAPSAASGGDLGNFQRGELPEEFEKAVFPLAPGTTSRIVRTRYGFHIFMVDEKILAHQQKLYEVADEIAEKLLLDRQRERIEREVAQLSSRIPVEIHRDRLGFKYVSARFGGNSNE